MPSLGGGRAGGGLVCSQDALPRLAQINGRVTTTLVWTSAQVCTIFPQTVLIPQFLHPSPPPQTGPRPSPAGLSHNFLNSKHPLRADKSLLQKPGEKCSGRYTWLSLCMETVWWSQKGLSVSQKTGCLSISALPLITWWPWEATWPCVTPFLHWPGCRMRSSCPYCIWDSPRAGRLGPKTWNLRQQEFIVPNLWGVTVWNLSVLSKGHREIWCRPLSSFSWFASNLW